MIRVVRHAYFGRGNVTREFNSLREAYAYILLHWELNIINRFVEEIADDVRRIV